MSYPEDNGAPGSGREEDARYPQPDDDDQLTWDQSLTQNNPFVSTPDGGWSFSSDQADHQVVNQQQTQSFGQGYYPFSGHYNQPSPALGPGQGYTGPLFNNPYAQQVAPGPPVQPGYYNPPTQQTYPAHQPVYTRPYIPTFDALRTPVAPIQPDAPANTETASNSVPKKRKGADEQEHEDDQLGQPPKKKSRNEKGIETKKQKADDKKHRNDLRQERDGLLARLSVMGRRMISDGTEQAEFEQLITSLTDLNNEIDGTTEQDIDYYSMRPEKRPARPTKKRYDG